MKIWNGFFWDPENSKSDHLTEISEISKFLIFRIVVKKYSPANGMNVEGRWRDIQITVSNSNLPYYMSSIYRP